MLSSYTGLRDWTDAEFAAILALRTQPTISGELHSYVWDNLTIYHCTWVAQEKAISETHVAWVVVASRDLEVPIGARVSRAPRARASYVYDARSPSGRLFVPFADRVRQ